MYGAVALVAKVTPSMRAYFVSMHIQLQELDGECWMSCLITSASWLSLDIDLNLKHERPRRRAVSLPEEIAGN